ncbi:hypothetical protein KSP39_PZI017552 [Platanthera zijinensis]|uniref:Uncharacterized protein n=1 Tax=Platanthera zijinensis TaxID=2320716 RepID=A0AAP0B6L8_9ASPA
MGQAWKKPKPGDQIASQQKEDVEIKTLIQNHLEANFSRMESSIQNIDDFYHSIYEIVEMLSAKKEAMQFKLPTTASINKVVNEVLEKRGRIASKNFPLTKEEVKEVITKLIKIENFHIGKSSKDIFLFIFAIPAIGLIAKRIIPGPTASIPDELFIPLATSGTIVALAKANRI